MNRRQILCLAGLCCLMTLLVGCRSTKKAVKDDTDVTTAATPVPPVTPAGDSFVARVIANRQMAKGLRSRVSVKLSYDGRSVSAGGALKMKRDEIIQVSVTALGIMEVGRLELTPQQLLVLDRVNKQYLQIAWHDVPELAQAGIDFSTFQALFWNELFVPGITGTPAATDFDIDEQAANRHIKPKAKRANTKAVAVSFLADAAKALLQQTNVVPADASRSMSFQCAYADWTTLAQKQFPRQMLLSVSASKKQYALTLNSSNLQTDETMGDLSTRVPTGYKRVTMEQIVRMLAQ